MKKIALVLICLVSSMVSMAQTSTVTLTSVKQYIRGFGGINLPEWQGSDLTTAQRNTAFGNGSGQIGMSVLRIYVSDNPNDWSKALATAKVAISMGLTVFATPWNPPASMCETVTRNNRQEKRLKYASYSDYAQHLINFNNYMKNNGVNLYAMSFANEPDWGFDWTWYSIDEVYNFVTSQASKLRVNGVKVITAESFSYNKTYYDKILNDPASLANIDIIGCHLYGSDANSPNSFFQYPLADQLATGKERWVTEHYTDSNNDANLWPMAHDVSYEIYRSMVEGQMSVYTWWYIRRNYGPIKEDGTVSKRGYCMSQYSKFIRPGYVRVDATKNPTTDVYVSAYKKGDDVVIVAVNRATSSKTITLSIPGTKVITWDKYVTSGTKNVAQETSISASSGSFQITLDAQSTTTFNGIAAVGTPTASITASGATSFCNGGSVVLNASTGTGYTYQWKLNGSSIANATSISYTATQSGSYTVTVTANSQSATSNAIIVTVNALPSAPTVTSPVTYCQNGISSTLTASGTSLKWYTVASGGTAATTAPTPTTTAAGTTNYYVSQTTNSCEGARATIAVTVNALPVITPYMQVDGGSWNQTSSTTICAGSSIVLGPQPTNASGWSWSGPGGYSATTREINLSSMTAGQSGNYIALYTDGNGCKASSVFAITVNTLPSAPTITSSQISYCQNATAAQLTATGSSLKWYTQASGGTSSATAPTPSTSTGGITNYYVSQTTNNCEGPRSTIAVTVNALPSAPTVISPVIYCQNATTTELTATGSSLKWYTQATGGTSLAAAPIPSTATAGTTNYYVSQTTNNCEGPRSMLAVTVNSLPTASITSGGNTTFCEGGSVILMASSGLSYIWFNGTARVGNSSSYTATTSGNYSVEVTNGSGCKSTSSAITVTVNALPTASITAGGPTTFTQGGSVLLSANTGTGLIYQWYNGLIEIGTGSTYIATTGGNYTLVVTNAAGCKTTSSVITVTVNGNQAPSVNITFPANSASFTSPANVIITATATDIDGTVAKVDFYSGNILLGTDPTSPYDFALNNLNTGSYTIVAVSIDNLGATTTSAAVTFTVINSLPTISITSPLNGSSFVENAIVTINADASDVNGTIAKVEFYNGNTLLGTDVSSPYSFTWSSVAAGTYDLTAKATDNEGGVATSSLVSITVTGNQPSVITITSPTNNSTVTGNTVTINVSATDPDGSITLVEYLDGTTVIGTSTTLPYSYTWNNPPTGTHVITVRVTDSNSGVTTSSPVTVTTEATTGLYSSNVNTINGDVYPNPAINELFVESEIDFTQASIQIVDLLGVIAETSVKIFQNHLAIDINGLADGPYLLIIKQEDKVFKKKFIVRR